MRIKVTPRTRAYVRRIFVGSPPLQVSHVSILIDLQPEPPLNKSARKLQIADVCMDDWEVYADYSCHVDFAGQLARIG
jgi:hypothetical protein